uniref:Protein Wnt n=1 Tax=Cacopsylla melanoneura TaxID=428564 RepID=A0A8D8M4Z4_9HEMI
MKVDVQLFLYILLRITVSGVSSIHWSTKYANDLQARGIAMCKSLSGLTKSQLDLCYKHPEVTSVALRGLRLAVEECQHQFHKNRWNCSSLITKNSNPHTSSLLKKGYKEASFSYAIIAAGVAHAVATACSQGSLLECACDPRPSKYDILAARHNNNNANSPHPHKKPPKKHQKFKWAGCSHNLDFGIQFSKRFLDSRERNGVDLQSQVNLHNNRVGRLMLRELMVEKCKCHGMSGSCEIRTCWHSAPNFRTVGEALKKKFSHAIRVDQSNMGNGMPLILPDYTRRYDNTLRNVRPRQGRVNTNRMKRGGGPRKHLNKMKTELIYYQKSPTYCERDNDVDFPGTAGRYCNKTSVFAIDNCESLCCGRGYNLRREVKNLKCNCKFKWCCTVECETCRKEEWNAVCK